MTYKVIRAFKDLTDPSEHQYEVGDIYPHDNHEPSEDFIQGLLNGSNSAGSIFIVVNDELDSENGNEEVPEGSENDNGPETEDPADDKENKEVETSENDKATEEVPVKQKRKGTKKAEV